MSTLFAIPSASATDARSWVPAVRYSLSILGAGGSEVRFRDVLDHISNHPDFPGWDHWGTSLKRNKPYPKAHRAVTLAAGKLKETGEITQPRRGYYMLGGVSAEVGEEEVREAVVAAVVPEPRPTPVVLATPTPALGLTVLPSTPPPTGSVYEQDAGLARIAIAQTRCYGWFSERSASCKGCPLAVLCQQAKMVVVAETAALLDQEMEDKIREQEQQVAVAEADAQAASLAAAREEAAPETLSDAPTGTVDERHLPDDATQMESLPFEVYCSGCNNTISAGSPAVHLPGKGAFHPGCAAV